jgi:hypothetical protein
MDDSLQRIAAAVAPAVMVSACGTLALGLDNQLARMSLRMRDLLKECRTAAVSADPRRRDVLLRQVEILGRRHARLSVGIFLAYTALFSFVLTSLLFLAQKIIGTPPALPIGTFAFGVVSLAGVALLAISSVRLSRAAIRLEMADAGLG